MLLDVDDSQLVLVDYQERLMPAIHDSAAVLANAVRLAQGGPGAHGWAAIAALWGARVYPPR